MNDDPLAGHIPSPDESSREWDTVVRRISERMRTTSEVVPQPVIKRAAPPSSPRDLSSELTRLERRALEAEASLASEREAYVGRVQEMQEKLRKIEPWIRKLKGEYETACTERDGLRAKLKRAKSRTSDSEVQALQTELQAAKVAREAARAELSAMRRQVETDRTSLQEAWQARIATAETARDQALDELKTARRGVAEARDHEEQVRRLRKEIESLETASAAHQAVARAAQEDQARLQGRVTELERTVALGEAKVRATSSNAEQRDQSLRTLERKLEQTTQELAASRDALENFELRVAEVDAAARDANIERDEAVRRLEAKESELETSKSKLTGLQQNVAALKAKLSQAEHALEQASTKGQRVAELEHQLAAAEGDLASAAAEQRASADRVAELERSLAEAAELSDAAMAAETELKAKLADVEAAHETLSAQLADRDRQVADQAARAERAEQDLATSQRDLETAQRTVSAIEAENRTLNDSVVAARAQAAQSLESSEEAWKSEMEAVERRFGTELERLRASLDRSEERCALLEQRLADAAEERGREMDRLRIEVPVLLRAALETAVTGFEAALGVHDDAVLRHLELPAADLTHSDTHHPAAASVGDEFLAATSRHGLPDWDQVLSDVEALSHEVRGLSTPEETSEIAHTETSSPNGGPGETVDDEMPSDLDFDVSAASGPDLDTDAPPSRVDLSELDEALEAIGDDTDGDHPDTCTIDATEVAAAADRSTEDSAAAEIGLADLDHTVPDTETDDGSGDDDDVSVDDHPDAGLEVDDSLDVQPRRRRRRRRK